MRLLTLQHVLAAVDLGPSTGAVIDTALRLARFSGAALHAVHVQSLSGDMDVGEGSPERAANRARAAFGDAGAQERDVDLHIVKGLPPAAIRALADRLRADVIVMGAPRKGAPGADGIPGGTAYAVVANTFVPCLVVSQPLQLPLERILVPIDISAPSRGALVIALSWASALRSRTDDQRTSLTVLHVQPRRRRVKKGRDDSDIVDRELEAVRHRAGDWAGVSARGITQSSGDVVSAISDCAIAQRADLVVIGTRGLGLDGVDRVGSVAAAVLGDLHAPVLVVPPGVWRAYAKDLETEPEGARRGRTASARDRDTGAPPGRRAG